jgi:hypothetical protein
MRIPSESVPTRARIALAATALLRCRVRRTPHATWSTDLLLLKRAQNGLVER